MQKVHRRVVKPLIWVFCRKDELVKSKRRAEETYITISSAVQNAQRAYISFGKRNHASKNGHSA